ncbi:MAG: SIS domain-containing protein [Chlamydiae bacterium]|nr:SIS domain-containing protein [Chlamydiota bacterium]
MKSLKDKIESSVQDGLRAIEFLQKKESVQFIEDCAYKIVACFKRGGKILIAGNGGSLCDAMHFAEELSGQYREKRPAMAAMALSDIGLMSCIANDFSYEYVFARGVEALGRQEDIFIGLTTSGNSANIVEAVKAAKTKQMETIIFNGKSGGILKGLSDLEWIVEGFKYSDRIQEAHMTAIHIIIEMIEEITNLALQNVDNIDLCYVS